MGGSLLEWAGGERFTLAHLPRAPPASRTQTVRTKQSHRTRAGRGWEKAREPLFSAARRECAHGSISSSPRCAVRIPQEPGTFQTGAQHANVPLLSDPVVPRSGTFAPGEESRASRFWVARGEMQVPKLLSQVT